MVIKSLKTSFIGGELSNKMQNRFDFDKYQSSAKFIENFNMTKEGNITYRNGTVYFANVNLDNDLTRKVKLLEWIKNETTIYLLVFSDLSLKIYKNFNLINTLTTIYTINDIFNIQIDYIGNNLYIVDGTHTPYILNCINDVFSLNAISFTTPPWEDENLTETTLKASGTSGNITITANTAIFDNTYLNKYIKIKNAANNTTGFAQITSVVSSTVVNTIVKTNFTTTTPTVDWWISLAPTTVIFYQSRLWYAKNNIIYASRTQDNNGISRFDDFTIGSDNDHAISLINTIFKTPILWLEANNSLLFAGTTTRTFLLNNTNTTGYLSPTNIPNIIPVNNDGCKSIRPLQYNNSLFFVSVIGIQNDTGSRLNCLNYNWESQGYITSNLNVFNEDINKEGIEEIVYIRGYDDILYCLKTNGELSCLNYDSAQSILGWSRLTIANWNRRKGKNGNDGIIESIASLRQMDGSDLLVMCIRRNINGIVKRYLEYLPKYQMQVNKIDYYTGNEEEDNRSYLYDLYQLQLQLNHLDCSSVYDGTINRNYTLSSITKGQATFICLDYTFSINDIGRQIKEYYDHNNQDGIATIAGYISEHMITINILKSFRNTTGNKFILSTNIITNLGYLEGKTVGTWCDGGKGQEYIINNGTITLNQQYFYIIVGLKYKGIIQTLDFNFDTQQGQNSIENKKSIQKVSIYFYNTVSCAIGTNLYRLEYLYNSPSEELGKPPIVYNGLKTFIIEDIPSESKNLFIYKNDYTPCSMQFINYNFNLN